MKKQKLHHRCQRVLLTGHSFERSRHPSKCHRRLQQLRVSSRSNFGGRRPLAYSAYYQDSEMCRRRTDFGVQEFHGVSIVRCVVEVGEDLVGYREWQLPIYKAEHSSPCSALVSCYSCSACRLAYSGWGSPSLALDKTCNSDYGSLQIPLKWARVPSRSPATCQQIPRTRSLSSC